MNSGSELGRGYVPLSGSAILIGSLICSFGGAAGMGPGGSDSRFRAQLEPGVRARTTKLIGRMPEAAHSPLVEFTKGNGTYCYWRLYRPLATLRLRRSGEHWHDCSLRGLRVGRGIMLAILASDGS